MPLVIEIKGASKSNFSWNDLTYCSSKSRFEDILNVMHGVIGVFSAKDQDLYVAECTADIFKPITNRMSHSLMVVRLLQRLSKVSKD